MMKDNQKKTKTTTEFGDFQTPKLLAKEICGLLKRSGVNPRSVVEPNCGLGSLLFASLNSFPSLEAGFALDISPAYIKTAKAEFSALGNNAKIKIVPGDFFHIKWRDVFCRLPKPILIIGNPPWVTNAALGTLRSNNLPLKSNFQNHRGLDAITGKSNFDISEWMLIKILDEIKEEQATMAMICKTAVARKLLLHAAKTNMHCRIFSAYLVDAKRHFNAAVDACLFISRPSSTKRRSFECNVYQSLRKSDEFRTIGYRSGIIVSNTRSYDRLKHLESSPLNIWRSGIKHDCSAVMQLKPEGQKFRNALGELVALESRYLFPMLKSSDLSDAAPKKPRYLLLVTQKSIKEDTLIIKDKAPKTWKYLQRHSGLFNRRRSSIYKKRPVFSIFGVGPYSFSPWKVGISGFYKRFEFCAIGPYKGKPVVLDDTCYFIPCDTKDIAYGLLSILQSTPAQEFYESIAFWDSKRPVTKQILERLDIVALSRDLAAPLK